MVPDMPKLTFWTGLGLAAFGVVVYLASSQASLTALIPTGFGLVLALLGFIAARSESPKHPMHAVAALALLGLLGSAGGVPDTLRLLAGQPVDMPLAAVSRTVMALALGVVLAFSIASFRRARHSAN